jgi:hypothetical protein
VAFAVHPGIDRYRAAMFPDMVYGKAYKPYVYRTLLPGLIRVAAEITPATVEEEVESLPDRNPTARRFTEMLRWQREYIYEYTLMLALTFLCFIGFLFVLRHLIKIFYDFPDFVADLAPAGAIIALPVYFRYCSYVYDPGTLFLFTLGMMLIMTRKRSLYYLVFILAALNKETSILLVALFYIRERGEMLRMRLWLHLICQGLIWAAIRVLLMLLYMNNPGVAIEFHLFDHNLTLYMYPTAFLYFAAVVAFHIPLLVSGWKHKPVFLRQGLIVTLAPLMSLALVFGFIDELRDYYEAYPFIFLLSLPTILRIFGIVPDTDNRNVRA